jgi:hypothetical protein
MGFVEEPMSYIEQYIGRRLPLAMMVIILVSWLAYIGQDVAASFVGGAFMIIMHGYYDDVSSEKQTIRMVEEANKEI